MISQAMFQNLFGDMTDHYYLQSANQTERPTELSSLLASFWSISIRYILVFAASKFCSDEVPFPNSTPTDQSGQKKEKRDSNIVMALNYLSNACWIIVFSHVVQKVSDGASAGATGGWMPIVRVVFAALYYYEKLN
jgi:hypothetical protein